MLSICLSFFFFNDTATTEIYTLSLHDALPIFVAEADAARALDAALGVEHHAPADVVTLRGVHLLLHETAGSAPVVLRSEEHTSELQSRLHLVCRLLLEKKKASSSRIENEFVT